MAGLELRLHPAAIAEARAARQWYADRSENAAAAFVSELDRAVESILSAPDRWPPYIEGTRRFLMRRFPFMVIYRQRLHVLEVVAVAHGRRKPGYWRRR